MDRHEHDSEGRGIPVEHVLSDTSDRRTALMWLIAALVFIAGLVVVAVAVSDPSPILPAVLAVSAAAALAIAWSKVRVWAGWSNPQLFLPSSDPLHLGDAITARLRRTARGRADLEGVAVSAVVRVEERVQSSERLPAAGKHYTSRTVEVVHEIPVAVTLNEDGGRRLEAELGIEIPLFEAPPSMNLPNNKVVWELIVSIEAPNAPDDVSSFPLVVAPEVALRLQAGGSGR